MSECGTEPRKPKRLRHNPRTEKLEVEVDDDGRIIFTSTPIDQEESEPDTGG